MAKSIYKDVDTKDEGVIETIIVDRITIKPMPTKELLELIGDAEKRKELKLDQITFEGSPQPSNKKNIGFGKDHILELQISDNGVSVPQKTIKFNERYTLDDGIQAFKELDQWLIDNCPNYSLEIYPKRLIIIDFGAEPSFATMIIKFEKRRKVDKKSEVGIMLNNQIMPLDAVMLYKAKFDSRSGEYLKNGVPSRIEEERKHYEEGTYLLKAEDVRTYTRNIYNSEFTMRNSCEVGKLRKVFDKYIPLPDGKCKVVPK